MNSIRSRTLAALVSAGLLWGSTVPLSKLALHWMPPGWLTFVRFTVAAALLLPAARHQLRAVLRPAVLASGALGYGATVLVQNAGITRTSVTHAALLIGTVPVMVAIIAAVWHRTVARPVAWAGFALSLAGIGLVTGGHGGGASTTGDALVLVSLLLSATFTVAQTRVLAGRDPVATTAVQFLGAALAVLPFAALTEPLPAVPVTPGPVLATAALAAGGTLLPFVLFAYAQSQVPAEVAGAFLNIEPFVGAVAGVVFFGNPVGMGQLAGGVAVLAGIALSALPLLAGGRTARARSGRDPGPAADEVPAAGLGDLAPGMEPVRPDPEAGVAAQLAGSKPVLAAKASPTSAPISPAAVSACMAPSVGTRSRAGPIPSRAVPVARRLRPVGLAAGAEISTVAVRGQPRVHRRGIQPGTVGRRRGNRRGGVPVPHRRRLKP